MFRSLCIIALLWSFIIYSCSKGAVRYENIYLLDNSAVVGAKVNGTEYPVLFDTGSTRTLLDSSFCVMSGAKFRYAGVVYTGAGRMKLYQITGGMNVEVLGFDISDNIYMVDLSNINAPREVYVAGILGLDDMLEMGLKIDLQKGIIYVD